MYRKIMVPVDLSHREKLEKAVATAADLAKHYEVPLQMVAVTASAPGSVAHNPKEFAAKLAEYAAAEGSKYGVDIGAHAVTSPDPAIDLDDKLGREAHDIGADLIVMASHVPGFAEHLFSSNAGYLASHTDISVFVVR
ncbi:MAG: universal stress protein [Kiloniellaceae bacterium]